MMCSGSIEKGELCQIFESFENVDEEDKKV